MLKTLTTESAKPRKGGVGIAGGSKARRDRNEFDGGEIKDDKVGKKIQKMSKSKTLFKCKKTVGFSDFLTPRAKLSFTKLRQAFFKAPILYYFNPKCHIRIETDISGYALGEVLS